MYLYCADDPINTIDPTGMYMPGDEKYSASQQAAIEDCSKAWFEAQSKGNQDGMDAVHAAANAISIAAEVDKICGSDKICRRKQKRIASLCIRYCLS